MSAVHTAGSGIQEHVPPDDWANAFHLNLFDHGTQEAAHPPLILIPFFIGIHLVAAKVKIPGVGENLVQLPPHVLQQIAHPRIQNVP